MLCIVCDSSIVNNNVRDWFADSDDGHGLGLTVLDRARARAGFLAVHHDATAPGAETAADRDGEATAMNGMEHP